MLSRLNQKFLYQETLFIINKFIVKRKKKKKSKYSTAENAEDMKMSTLGCCSGNLWNSVMEDSARGRHLVAHLSYRLLSQILQEQGSRPVSLLLPSRVPCCLLLTLLFAIYVEFGAFHSSCKTKHNKATTVLWGCVR